MLPLRDARPPRRTPVVTGALLAACGLVFGYELVVLAAGGDAALEGLVTQHGLVPAEVVAALAGQAPPAGTAADLLSHMFLHAGWLHLLANALFLWIFAPNVEDRLGRPLFLVLFLAGGVAAALAHVAVDPASPLPMIGASGAISAVLGAYVVLFPRARIQSLVFLIFYYELVAVPSVVVLGFWFAVQLIDGFASLGLTAEAAGGIAFWAHVGGFVAGAAMALAFRLLRGPARDAEPAPAPGPVPLPPPPPPA